MYKVAEVLNKQNPAMCKALFLLQHAHAEIPQRYLDGLCKITVSASEKPEEQLSMKEDLDWDRTEALVRQLKCLGRHVLFLLLRKKNRLGRTEAVNFELNVALGA